jgi:carbon storage regulator CsrA
MLVLGRRRGERVAIDTPAGRIWVLVIDAPIGGKVRLGIDAPGDVRVTREELLARSGHDGQSEGSPEHDAPMATDGP